MKRLVLFAEQNPIEKGNGERIFENFLVQKFISLRPDYAFSRNYLQQYLWLPICF